MWVKKYIFNNLQDDLIYFFWLGPLINEDMKVSRRWMKYFINFVNHGLVKLIQIVHIPIFAVILWVYCISYTV